VGVVEGTPHNPTRGGEARDVGTLLGPEAGLQVQSLGDFELRREIGRGGMGTVYEAWQRSLCRIVALKVLARHVSESPAAIVRFQREAQAAAKLHHQHIIPIHALGHERGHYFYAMEYVDGLSLHQIIAAAQAQLGANAGDADSEETVAVRLPEGASGGSGTGGGTSANAAGSTPPGDVASSAAGSGSIHVPAEHPATESIACAVQRDAEHFQLVARHIAAVADALDYAHGQGVIHRDIKPHNLMLGHDGRMMVSDFGLARLAEEPGVTVSGELIGSPLYMSREQLSGNPEAVDDRTDIYSLGATLYEWLTLRPPYPGDTRERVISMVLNEDPVPPRVHDPRVPVDLETICLKAMEKTPERRYQRGRDMATDLRAFLARQPIAARRAGALVRTGKFVSRHQLALLTSAAAVVALALGSALLMTRSTVQQQTTAVEHAQTRVEALEQEAEQAKAERDYLLLQMLGLPSLAAGRSLLEAGASTVGPVVENLVQTGQQVVSASGTVRGGGASSTEVGTPLGLARRVARDYIEAVYPQRAAPVDLVNLGPGVDERQVLLDQARTAADPAEALRLVEAALRLNPNDVEAHMLRALWSCQAQDHAGMLREAEVLLTLRPEAEMGYVWRGLARLLSGDTEGSLADCEAALKLDGLSIWARTLRGLDLLHAGRAMEALLEFNSTLTLSPDHPVALLGRAVVHRADGHLEDAAGDVSRVLTVEPTNADALALRGELLAALGRYAEAAADFKQSMDLAGRTEAMLGQFVTTLAKARLGEQQKGPGEAEQGAAGTPASTPSGRAGEDRKPEPVSPADGTSSLHPGRATRRTYASAWWRP